MAPVTLSVDGPAVFDLLLSVNAQVQRTLADAVASGGDVEAARESTAPLAEAVRLVGAALAEAGFTPTPEQLTRTPAVQAPVAPPPPVHHRQHNASAIRTARINTGPGSGGYGFPGR